MTYPYIFELLILYLINILYSSLPDTTTESGGKYTEVYHFAGKHNVEQHIRKLGIPNVTFIYLGFYAQNIGTLAPLVQKDGEVGVAFPYLGENDVLPIIDAQSDTGVRVY